MQQTKNNGSGLYHAGTPSAELIHSRQITVDQSAHTRVGRPAPPLRPTPLNSLLAAALRRLKPECCGRIDWRIGDLGIMACDPESMEQVFVKLLSNALKYTAFRDYAVIEVGQSTLNGERVIFIRDNGIGFDTRYADTFFGRRQQVPAADQFEAPTVGLATVERIVRRHGGRIWAQAEPGLGATFFFTVGPCEPSQNP